MIFKVIAGIGCVLVSSAIGAPTREDEDAMRAAIRARMALLRLHTAVSSDRVIIVSGPRPSSNAYLLEAVQQQRAAIERLLRMQVPFHGQRIRLQVLPSDEGDQDEEQGILLRSQIVLGDLTHRILLPDYESSFSQTAQEALIYAFLSAYVLDAGDGKTRPYLPPWFWQGVMYVLYPDDVKITLDYVHDLWRSGRIPSLSGFLNDFQEDRLGEGDARFAGAVVYWLLSRPRHLRLRAELFAAFAAEEVVDINWLRERLPADPDELLDRWILTQRRVVRGVGTVLQSHLDDLQELLFLYPGRHGIPRSADISWGAPLHTLVKHRESTWFRDAIHWRRNRLQLVSQGRPTQFQEIVDAFIGVLDGVLSGAEIVELEEQEQGAHTSLALFAVQVQERGGVWREDEGDF